MSEQEQQQYKKETNKRPLYFNKPSNDFKAWLNKKDKMTDEEKVEEVIKKQSEKEFADRFMQEAEPIIIVDDEYSPEDIELWKLEKIRGEQELLKEEEEAEIDDIIDKITELGEEDMDKTIEKLLDEELERQLTTQNMEEAIQKVIKEENTKKSGNLKNWL